MWSIYDTLVLVSGIIVLAIAILPVAGIPAATRLWSGAIGGGLVLLAFVLGSLRYFRYPSVVVAGPVIALLALAAIVVDARKRTNPNQAGLAPEQQGSGPQPLLPDLPAIAPAAIAQPEAEPVDPDRAAAWREVHSASTSAERLAGIAGRYPEFGPQMLNHPNAYPELREWIRQLPGTQE